MEAGRYCGRQTGTDEGRQVQWEADSTVGGQTGTVGGRQIM